MSNQIIMAAIGALPAFVASVAAAILGFMNTKKANVIHQLVNSNLKAVQSDLAEANERITQLQTLVARMSQKQP